MQVSYDPPSELDRSPRHLTSQRASNLVDTTMVSVAGIQLENLELACEQVGDVFVANRLTPSLFTIAGTQDSCKVTLNRLVYSQHSDLLDPSALSH